MRYSIAITYPSICYAHNSLYNNLNFYTNIPNNILRDTWKNQIKGSGTDNISIEKIKMETGK